MGEQTGRSPEDRYEEQADAPTDAVETNEPTRGLGAGSALLILLGYLGTQLLSGVLIAVVANIGLTLSRANLDDPSTRARLQSAIEASVIMVSVMLSGFVLVLLVRYFARGAIGGRSAEGIAWSGGTVAELTLGGLVGGLLGLGYVLVASWLFPPPPDFSIGPLARLALTPGLARLCWVVLGLALAPPLEELLFRGVLFSGLARSWGRGAGAVLSTVLFTALHLPETLGYWPAVLAITLLGGSALALRLHTSAVGPAVAVHFAYNCVGVVTIYGFF
jgi:membrane protease YdiL (CAAX protease family)